MAIKTTVLVEVTSHEDGYSGYCEERHLLVGATTRAKLAESVLEMLIYQCQKDNEKPGEFEIVLRDLTF